MVFLVLIFLLFVHKKCRRFCSISPKKLEIKLRRKRRFPTIGRRRQSFSDIDGVGPAPGGMQGHHDLIPTNPPISTEPIPSNLNLEAAQPVKIFDEVTTAAAH